MANRERSIVEYFAEHEHYRCGYCGGIDTNYSHGMWAHSMTNEDYQDLIDRGWRRSGKYCYKPTMSMMCCPHYTIRQDAFNFQPSKSQKKVIKRVNRFLITGERPGTKEMFNDGDTDMVGEGAGGDNFVSTRSSELSLSPSDVKADKTGGEAASPSSSKTSAAPAQQESKKPGQGTDGGASDQSASKTESQASATKEKEKTVKSPPKPGLGPDASKPRCRKAKEIRIERRMNKSGQSAEQPCKNPHKNNEAKSLEDFLNEPLKAENPSHHLEVKLVQTCPKSSEYRFTFKESFELFRRYQVAIHKEKESENTQDTYTSFLVDSPLQAEAAREDGSPHGYGSFHQQYILDGKIIAVGVVDILPHCLSSVYLYYDPDYSFLSLGTYSALREIAFVRELQKTTAQLRWYYMGFYIHSCPKMRYKGHYYPSLLLCPEAYTWVPIEKCLPKLNTSAYSRLEEEGVVGDNSNIDLDRVLVLYDREAMPYEVYRFMNCHAHDEEEVGEYAGLVGHKCAQRMLLFRK